MVASAVLLVVVMVMVALMAVIVIYATSYKKVPPNQAMVVFRGKRKPGDEPRGILSGGGKFIIPGGETYHLLDLTADMVRLELNGVQTTSNGSPTKMRIQLAAIWKLSSERDALKMNAGKQIDRTVGENRMAVKEMLENTIRNLAASSTLEEIESDRDMLAARVQHSAMDLMAELGIEIRSLVLLNVKPQG